MILHSLHKIRTGECGSLKAAIMKRFLISKREAQDAGKDI